MRVLEILKLSKVCRTSTKVQSAIISIGNILDFLINDVEWNLAIGQHASVIASIQDTVMSIESARHFGKINSKEEEEYLILENTEHLVSVRKEHPGDVVKFKRLTGLQMYHVDCLQLSTRPYGMKV
ncbi:hypothetical protein PHMEG_00020170 [Phytophthora megakarya]|uniref:Uncharacterized protein n=1 Tax=Phytophthora megakarya TaxID=4795 RepID=A0A225VQ30_9STRA|nr:hypothetical protein PHMEG_00020170 [Phytophthora megakarya]